MSAIDYSEFLEQMQSKIRDANDSENEKTNFVRLNYQRSLRIGKTYVVPEEVNDIIQAIDFPIYLYALTEDWCGDSAQTLPFLVKITEQNPNIHFKIILRDQNPEIMERYLTNGKKSIPKIVAFNEAGNELFQWGPRPEPAATLFNDGIQFGLSREEIQKSIHTWYAKDRGKSLEREFLDKISGSIVQKPVADSFCYSPNEQSV